MIFRKTTLNDIDDVMMIINQAKEYMKSQGFDQWQDGYPNAQIIQDDINRGEGFVLCDQDQVIATCMVTLNGEPNYDVIDGQWLNNDPYITIHRIATNNKYKGKGISKQMVDEVISMYPDFHNIKADTHDDNLSMQRFLTKNGFQYCGIITLDNGDTRRAYQKLISKDEL